MSDWARQPAALPSLEWEFIAKQSIATSVAAVDFAGIAPLYRRFRLEAYIVAQSTVNASLRVAFNNDQAISTNHYEYSRMDWLVQNALGIILNPDRLQQDNCNFSTVLANRWGASWMFVEKPSASGPAKFLIRHLADHFTSSIPSTNRMEAFCWDGEWTNTTDLISSINLSGSMAAGSRFVLSGARESLT